MGPGSTLLSTALCLVSGSPRMVKYAGMPGVTLGTSASEICASMRMVSRLASLMMVGADCMALTVCPSLVTMDTTTPSDGAVMRV